MTERDLRWQHAIGPGRVAAFYIEHRLSRCCRHNVEDFLVACHNALRPGGRLRIVEPDFAHPSSAYRKLVDLPGVRTRFDEPLLAGLLQKAGFAVRPVEFYDQDGVFNLRVRELDPGGLPARSRTTDPRGADPALGYSSLVVDAFKPGPSDGLFCFAGPIVAVGDSHARFLAGKDDIEGARTLAHDIRHYDGFAARFSAFHLGPALAYSLENAASTVRVLAKMAYLLEARLLAAGQRTMFSFGEIDCRAHIVRHVEATGRTIEDVAADACANYAQFLDRMASSGLRPMVWGPVASTPNQHYVDQTMPLYGSLVQRNAAIAAFTATMQRLCQQRSYPFLSVATRLMTGDGGTQHEYYADDIHLSQRARPLLWDLMPE